MEATLLRDADAAKTAGPNETPPVWLDYQLIFDNALVGICFMRDRRFVQANRRMEEIFGYGPGELIGQPVRMLYASEEDFIAVGRLYQGMRKQQRCVHERQMLRKDGEFIWCQMTGTLVAPDDPMLASVWVVQDITEKKQAELRLERAKQRLEATVRQRTLNLQKSNLALQEEIERRRGMERQLLESREKYRVLFRNIPLGIVITDEDGEPLEINQGMKQLLEVDGMRAFVAAASARDRLESDDGHSGSLLQFLAHATPVDGGGVRRGRLRWTAADGGSRDIDMVAVRLHVRGLGAAFVFDDVTAQRVARQREIEQKETLERSGRLALMGQFATALAHELGQPLNACESYIAGISHRLQRGASETSDLQEGVDRIGLHLQQAGNIVRNVRAFVARHRPDDELVDLSALVDNTLDLLELQLRMARVRSIVHAPQQPAQALTVRGSRTELQQVLMNLVVNAIEALRDSTHASRQIDIDLHRDDAQRVVLRVCDNGPGVDVRQRADIFEPYQTTKARGLGMGLSICRTIIESHGGVLALTDPEGGAGACFVCSLPCADTRDE